MITLPTWAVVLICIVGAILIIALIIAFWMAWEFGKMAIGFIDGISGALGGPNVLPREKRK